MSRTTVKAIPDGMHSLTPHLVCAGAAHAIEFYKKAFNAVELMRLPGPDGSLMHACLTIGSSQLFLVDENVGCGVLGPKSLKGSAVTIHLQVEDADAAFAQAVAAGAAVKMPIEDTFWGDRFGQLEDPFGQSWSVAAHVRDVSPEDTASALQQAFAKQP